MDEENSEDRLEYLLPQHEFFHQGMVLADVESELFRDGSRGLEGGAFFTATLLNRKEALTAKGKHAVVYLKDLYILKSDARFIQFFLTKLKLDPLLDNTPPLLKTASSEKKLAYLHSLVSGCLKDLLPYFDKSNLSNESSSNLCDHPLQKGRKSSDPPVLAQHHVSEVFSTSTLISNEVAEATAAEVMTQQPPEIDLQDYLEKSTVQVSSKRTKTVYVCRLCSLESKYATVILSHIESCLNAAKSKDAEDNSDAAEEGFEDDDGQVDGEDGAARQRLKEEDMFFNYKNAEFFIDAIFALMTIFERFGDGVGCFIVSKILLPIFHGLNHSNYTCSIHRFVVRVLCEASPKEGLKLIHERFSNRAGKPGKNVFRDRRMEFRIGITKKLIGNLAIVRKSRHFILPS